MVPPLINRGDILTSYSRRRHHATPAKQALVETHPLVRERGMGGRDV